MEEAAAPVSLLGGDPWHDAAKLHRTNGGLVRVMVPVAPDVDARAAAAAFASAMMPHLERLMP